MAKNQAIYINNTSIFPGEKKVVMLPMPQLYDGSPTVMPIHVICGKQAGATLVITAAIHGDEINGVDIIRRLLKRKALKHLDGNLIAVPIVNMQGFLQQSRYLADRRDLNRCFPGSEKGSIAARLAYVLLKTLTPHATHVIDLHTGSQHRYNLPQIRADLDNEASYGLAKAFNAPVTLDSKAPNGSFRQSLNHLGVPNIIYEAGEASRFDDFSIRAGVRGILQAMQQLAMLSAKHVKFSPQPPSNIAYSSHWLRASHSGILLLKKKLGDKINKGEMIATVANPLLGEEKNLYSEKTGIIIGQTRLPLVHAGEAISHIASVEKPTQASERIAEWEDYVS